jgi:hypothetical protein
MFDKFTPETLTTNLQAYRAYNGSLDAAKALHDAVLGDYVWIASAGCVEVFGPKKGQKFITFCEDKTPARAWLIAIIKALIAEADA